MKFIRKSKSKRNRGFTLIELLLVVAIILILAGLSFPVYQALVRQANRTHTVAGLGSMVNAVHLWGADNSGKIPSPIYPGDHTGTLPQYHDLNVGGETGMWLNGVIYAAVALGMDRFNAGDSVNITQSSNVESGGHLVGTVFESKSSTRAMGYDRDWYHHSYAMNANLQYDEINRHRPGGGGEAWLTEKTVANLNQPKAMIFIDCIDANVIFADQVDLLFDTADRRHNGKFVLAGFLDGSVRTLAKSEIPIGSVTTDLESSLFWRGVDRDR